MTRTTITIILIGVASWIAIAVLTGGDGRLADYTFIGVILFGYILLTLTSRKEVARMNREAAEKLEKSLVTTQAKAKSLDEAKAQLVSVVSKELPAPISEAKRSLSLLLEGTYGKLPPAAEESVEQVLEKITGLEQNMHTRLADFEAKEAASIPSPSGIRNLKVN